MDKHIITKLVVAFLCLPPVFTLGNPVSFDLSPLGKMNKVGIELETGFGSGKVKGRMSQIAGKIKLSVNKPTQSNGEIVMDARSLRFGYGKVDVDAHRAEWLDSSQFPKILFNLESLSNAYWRGEFMHADANGKMLIKGKSIPLTIPVTIKYLRAERRVYDGKSGDILLVKGEFPLSRGAFGINSDTALDTVLDAITVHIQLMGGSKKIRPFLPCRIFGGTP
jgi:polyisoprenoid-binding protein YceI